MSKIYDILISFLASLESWFSHKIDQNKIEYYIMAKMLDGKKHSLIDLSLDMKYQIMDLNLGMQALARKGYLKPFITPENLRYDFDQKESKWEITPQGREYFKNYHDNH